MLPLLVFFYFTPEILHHYRISISVVIWNLSLMYTEGVIDEKQEHHMWVPNLGCGVHDEDKKFKSASDVY